MKQSNKIKKQEPISADGPCKDCLGFLALNKRSRKGWCIYRSTLPHNGLNGFVPPQAKVAKNPEDLAKPFIVTQDSIIKKCPFRRV